MTQITPQDMMALQTNNDNVFAAQARPALNRLIQMDLLSPAAKRMVTILNAWDLKNDENSKGITVFKLIWDSVESAVWSDELAGSKLDKVETLKDQVNVGIERATQQLLILEKENKLTWGSFKATRVVHLTKIPALSRLNLPIGGGVNIINATTENHGPSWRMVVHMTDEIEAYGLYPGGQSGNPGSPFYDNFVDYWAAGKYYRLLFLSKEKLKESERAKWHMQFKHA